MTRLRYLTLWPVGPPPGPEADPVALCDSGRPVAAVLLESLQSVPVVNRSSELRFFVRQGSGPDMVVEVLDFRESFDSATVQVPPGFAELAESARAMTALEVLDLAGHRMIELRAWPESALAAARAAVLQASRSGELQIDENAPRPVVRLAGPPPPDREWLQVGGFGFGPRFYHGGFQMAPYESLLEPLMDMGRKVAARTASQGLAWLESAGITRLQVNVSFDEGDARLGRVRIDRRTRPGWVELEAELLIDPDPLLPLDPDTLQVHIRRRTANEASPQPPTRLVLWWGERGGLRSVA